MSESEKYSVSEAPNEQNFKVELPDPPEILKPEFLRAKGFTGRIKAAFAMFGPGAIIASVTLGSGEVIWAPRAAAIFGFTILWAYFWGVIFKLGVIYPLVRYRVIAGESPVNILKHIPPRGWVVWFFVIMILLCIASWNAAFIGMNGILMTKMTGVGNVATWGIAMMTLALILVLVGGYRFLEKGQTIIIFGVVILMWIAVAMVRPEWIEVIKGLIPQPVSYPAWVHEKYPEIVSRNIWIEVGMYLGALGGGMYDYFAFLRYAKERKWGLLAHENADEIVDILESIPSDRKLPLLPTKENIERALAWMKAPFYDQVISFFVAIGLGTLPFLVLGATILHPQQLVPAGFKLVEHQVQFLEIISPYAIPLYWLGMFFAIFGTSWGMLDTHASSVYELVRTVWPKAEKIGYNKFRLFPIFWEYVLGVLIFLTGIKPAQAVAFGGTLGGVFGIGLFGFLILYVENKRLPKEFRLSTGWMALLIISSVFLLALGSYSMYQLIIGWIS